MIRFFLAFVASGLVSGAGQIETQPSPESAETDYSRFVSRGDANQFLDALNSSPERLARAEDLELALMVLEQLPDTSAYLTTPLADALAGKLEQEIALAIRCSVFADLRCITGESAAIEAGFSRASRYQQISLPILWKLLKTDRDWGETNGSKERAALHIRRVMKMIINGSTSLDLCRERLRAGGLGELADELLQTQPR